MACRCWRELNDWRGHAERPRDGASEEHRDAVALMECAQFEARSALAGDQGSNGPCWPRTRRVLQSSQQGLSLDVVYSRWRAKHKSLLPWRKIIRKRGVSLAWSLSLGADTQGEADATCFNDDAQPR